MHKGRLVRAWLAKHLRFQLHHPPVHFSWMNQIEQWFRILQCKRLGIANFTDQKELAYRLDAFVQPMEPPRARGSLVEEVLRQSPGRVREEHGSGRLI
jgi:hypothetical protein